MVGALQYPQSVFQALILSKTVCPDDHTGWPRLTLRGGRAENVLTISRQPRWSAIGMSSKRWLTACTGCKQESARSTSPDFAPTLRDRCFAHARSGAVCGVASPAARILAIARLLLRYRVREGRPLASLHPIPQSHCHGARRSSTRSCDPRGREARFEHLRAKKSLPRGGLNSNRMAAGAHRPAVLLRIGR